MIRISNVYGSSRFVSNSQVDLWIEPDTIYELDINLTYRNGIETIPNNYFEFIRYQNGTNLEIKQSISEQDNIYSFYSISGQFIFNIKYL